MKARMQKILVAIPTNGSDGQLRFGGILRFASRQPSWDIRFIRSRTAFNDEEVKALMDDDGGVAGCILAAYTPAVEQLLSAGVPCVATLENLHERLNRYPSFRSVFIDNEEIGVAAAEHFKSLGSFSSYAFVPAPPSIPWSLERKSTFRTAADKRAAFFEFPEADFEMKNLSGENGITMRIRAIEEFLRSLPKPAAVFGANDVLAMQILNACRVAKLKVPSEVAIIGCDNDELICQNTKPQLTSIQPNFIRVGFMAAKMLNDLIRGRDVPCTPVRIGGVEMIQRGSTSHLPPSVALVRRAMDYIKAHAIDGISTSDVVEHLRVSRSLLDLRFRQIRRQSVMDAVIDARLSAVRHQLASTKRTILSIGEACGFRNAEYLKRLFRRRFGVSMSEFRSGGCRARGDATQKQYHSKHKFRMA